MPSGAATGNTKTESRRTCLPQHFVCKQRAAFASKLHGWLHFVFQSDIAAVSSVCWDLLKAGSSRFNLTLGGAGGCQLHSWDHAADTTLSLPSSIVPPVRPWQRWQLKLTKPRQQRRNADYRNISKRTYTQASCITLWHDGQEQQLEQLYCGTLFLAKSKLHLPQALLPVSKRRECLSSDTTAQSRGLSVTQPAGTW